MKNKECDPCISCQYYMNCINSIQFLYNGNCETEDSIRWKTCFTTINPHRKNYKAKKQEVTKILCLTCDYYYICKNQKGSSECDKYSKKQTKKEKLKMKDCTTCSHLFLKHLLNDSGACSECEKLSNYSNVNGDKSCALCHYNSDNYYRTPEKCLVCVNKANWHLNERLITEIKEKRSKLNKKQTPKLKMNNCSTCETCSECENSSKYKNVNSVVPETNCNTCKYWRNDYILKDNEKKCLPCRNYGNWELKELKEIKQPDKQKEYSYKIEDYYLGFDIYKSKILERAETTILCPADNKTLSVSVSNDTIFVNILQCNNSRNTKVKKTFVIYPNDVKILEDISRLKFIGTCVVEKEIYPDKYVVALHVFEYI